MTAKQHVAAVKRRLFFGVVFVPVRGEKSYSVRNDQCIISHYRKIKDRLIDFGIAIPAYTDNIVFKRIKRFYNLFRSVFIGKIVARTVIKDIAEQNDPLGFFLFISFYKFIAIQG